MVLKTKKPGFAGFNTGRTLRSSQPSHHDRKYAFVRCTTTAATAHGLAALSTVLSEVSIALPPAGVEYSLNKKGRWKIADCIKDELLPLRADECQIKLFEHHHRPTTRDGSACIAFHSNAGPVLQRSPPHGYMNARSVTGETSGQLSNRQRRRLIRSGKSVLSVDGQSFTTAGHTQLVCDVVHAVPSSSSAFHTSRQYIPKSAKRTAPRDRGQVLSDEVRQAGLPLRLLHARAGQALDILADADDCRDLPKLATSCDDDDNGIAVTLADDVDSALLLQPSSRGAPLLVSLADAVCLTRSAKHGDKHVYAKNRDCADSNESPNTIGRSGTAARSSGSQHSDVPPSARRHTHSSDGLVVGCGLPLSSYAAGTTDEAESTALPPASLAVANQSTTRPVLPPPPAICIRHEGGCEGIGRQLREMFPQRYVECQCQPTMMTLRLGAWPPAAPAVAGQDRRGQYHCPERLGQTEACLVIQQLLDSTSYCLWLAAGSEREAVALPTVRGGSTYSLEELLAGAEACLQPASHRVSRQQSPIISRSAVDGTGTNYCILGTGRGWTVTSRSLAQVYEQLPVRCAVSEASLQRSGKLASQNHTDETRNAIWKLSDSRTNCGACLADATNLNVRAFALSECGHIFCFECWQVYLSGKIAGGSTILQCPEYQCCAQVDHAMVLATCGISAAERYRMQQMEAEVRKQLNVVWCPNHHCSRMLLMQCEGQTGSGGKQDEPASVSCACGSSTCFGCLEEAHWPLTCRQAATYHARLTQQGLYIVSSAATFFSAVQVSTKPCPACRYPIEKSEGCQHIHCTKCSTDFCWGCVTVLPSDVARRYAHLNSCQVNVKARDEEFSAASMWSRRSQLSNRAVRHRAYRSAAMAKQLRNKIALLAARAKPHELSEYAASCGYAVPSIKYEEKLKSMEQRLHSIVLAFKFEAHSIVESSLVCLELGHRAGCCQGDADSMQLRRRALAEVGRLEFILDRLEDLVEHLSNPSCPQPTARHLSHVDSLAACGKQKLCSLIRLMTAYQGY